MTASVVMMTTRHVAEQAMMRMSSCVDNRLSASSAAAADDRLVVRLTISARSVDTTLLLASAM